MDNVKDGKSVDGQNPSGGVGGPSVSMDREAGRAKRDDTSEEAILDNKSIAHTRTFQVQYSN